MFFSKMHGLGNDFIVIDCVTQKVVLKKNVIQNLANRYTGIGFDQLLLIEPPYSADVDFHYRIFNADGNEVEQCGNGARCFAKFVKLKKLINKNTIKVSTTNGNLTLNINDDNSIKVDMGIPQFDPKLIPFQATKEEKNYIIVAGQQTVSCGVVSMGNPHCVVQVDDINTTLVTTLGPVLEKHDAFPNNANIGFMQTLDRQNILLRVYERGVGETRACGSGACAAVAVGINQGLLDNKVNVKLLGGNLEIEWQGHDQPLYMKGEATHVYDGIIKI